VVAVPVERLEGREAWRYGYYCALCGCVIGPEEEVAVVAGAPVHAACLERALRMSDREFEELAKRTYVLFAEELRKLRTEAKTAPPATPASAIASAPASASTVVAELEDPPEVRILTREERRALWSKARSIVSSALERAGVRRVGEMRVDGMAPEPYLKFLGGIREGVERLSKERRVELRVHPATEKGLGRTDVFVDGEYWGTWLPPDPYVSSFWGWVRRVYNLLRDLAERDLLAVDPAVSTGPCGMGEEELE
jgi:hypothetical protein